MQSIIGNVSGATAGIWTLVLFAGTSLGTILVFLPKWRKATADAASNLIGHAFTRLDKVEATLEKVQADCKEEREHCAEQLAELRHDRNNDKQAMAIATALAEHAPEKLTAFLAKHKAMPSPNEGLAELARQVERKG